MEDFDNFASSVPRIINYYGKLGRYCTFCRVGGFLKRENLSSAVDSGLPRYHIRRYWLDLVFRTKLCKTGAQQAPSRVPSYYYILVAKGGGTGVFSTRVTFVNRSRTHNTGAELPVELGARPGPVTKIRYRWVCERPVDLILNLVTLSGVTICIYPAEPMVLSVQIEKEILST
jgi:hypothetical protein